MSVYISPEEKAQYEFSMKVGRAKPFSDPKFRTYLNNYIHSQGYTFNRANVKNGSGKGYSYADDDTATKLIDQATHNWISNSLNFNYGDIHYNPWQHKPADNYMRASFVNTNNRAPNAGEIALVNQIWQEAPQYAQDLYNLYTTYGPIAPNAVDKIREKYAAISEFTRKAQDMQQKKAEGANNYNASGFTEPNADDKLMSWYSDILGFDPMTGKFSFEEEIRKNAVNWEAKQDAASALSKIEEKIIADPTKAEQYVQEYAGVLRAAGYDIDEVKKRAKENAVKYALWTVQEQVRRNQQHDQVKKGKLEDYLDPDKYKEIIENYIMAVELRGGKQLRGEELAQAMREIERAKERIAMKSSLQMLEDSNLPYKGSYPLLRELQMTSLEPSVPTAEDIVLKHMAKKAEDPEQPQETAPHKEPGFLNALWLGLKQGSASTNAAFSRLLTDFPEGVERGINPNSLASDPFSELQYIVMRQKAYDAAVAERLKDSNTPIAQLLAQGHTLSEIAGWKGVNDFINRNAMPIYNEVVKGITPEIDKSDANLTDDQKLNNYVYLLQALGFTTQRVRQAAITNKYSNLALKYNAERQSNSEFTNFCSDIFASVEPMAISMALNAIPGYGQMLSTQFWVMYGAGSGAEEARLQGATPQQQRVYSTISAATEGVLAVMQGRFFNPPLVRAGAKQIGKTFSQKTFKFMLHSVEMIAGMEAQQIAMNMTAKYSFAPDKPWQGEGGIFDLKQMLHILVSGATLCLFSQVIGLGVKKGIGMKEYRSTAYLRKALENGEIPDIKRVIDLLRQDVKAHPGDVEAARLLKAYEEGIAAAPKRPWTKVEYDRWIQSNLLDSTRVKSHPKMQKATENTFNAHDKTRAELAGFEWSKSTGSEMTGSHPMLTSLDQQFRIIRKGNIYEVGIHARNRPGFVIIGEARSLRQAEKMVSDAAEAMGARPGGAAVAEGTGTGGSINSRSRQLSNGIKEGMPGKGGKAWGEGELINNTESVLNLRNAWEYREYIRDIEQQTGRKISNKQLNKLAEAIKNSKFSELDKASKKLHRKVFKDNKPTLISEWEKQTGQMWPRYDKPIFDKNGEIARVGDLCGSRKNL